MSFSKFKHNLSIKFLGFMMNFMGSPSYMLFAGAGSSAQLCQHIKRSGLKKVLVVTDKPLVELGVVDRAIAVLKDSDVSVSVYDGVLPDPTFKIVSEGLARYQQDQCDSILAIGGGSSIDAAKIIGMCATNPGDPRDYVGFNKANEPLPPLFAIPTTSGTGSEATRGAVISDSETHEKAIIAGGTLGPVAACLDSELLTGLPPHITAATGMDALTHAIEAYICVWDRGNARELGANAIRIIFDQLPTAYADGANVDARDAMAYAAYLAGQAINEVNVGNVHAVAHQLGGSYGIPHGLANAMVLPEVLDCSIDDCRERLAELARLVGKGSTAEEFIAAVRELNTVLGIPDKVEQLKDADIPAITQRAVDEGNGYASPWFMEHDACSALLRRLLPNGSDFCPS